MSKYIISSLRKRSASFVFVYPIKCVAVLYLSNCRLSYYRYFLREKSEKEIARRPAYRAVDKACAKEGFKTVFTLRLSPLLPIPIGAYNYLYGVTSVSPLDFIAGISLGSIKPYLLDSYLGKLVSVILFFSPSSSSSLLIMPSVTSEQFLVLQSLSTAPIEFSDI